jgi:glutathione peroxidase
MVWGCALLLACLQTGAAQRDAAKPKDPAPKEPTKDQTRTAKPKAQPDGEKPAGDGEGAPAGGGRGRGNRGGGEKSDKPERTIYDFELPGPDGKGVAMSEFKGKVILLVNLARQSSYNDQLPALIKLSEQFKDKGLVVIGVPSNDFGTGEPGTDAEIQKAYADAKVPFPVMGRSLLIGDQQLPLYEFLTKGEAGSGGGGGRAGGAQAGGPGGGTGGGAGGGAPSPSGSSTGDVHWNYTKFLIDRNGKTVARLDPDVAPDSAEMLATLDKLFDNLDDKPRPGGQRPGGKQQQPAKASNGDGKDSNGKDSNNKDSNI